MWLNQKLKKAVTVPAPSEAPTAADWRQHADSGDLVIEDGRLEVKQLSARFSCRDDWPYRDKFIVCGKNAFDRADPRPVAFLILSAIPGYLAVVMSDTADQWYTESRIDSRYHQYRQEFYFCPMDAVLFFWMGPEWAALAEHFLGRGALNG